MECLTAHLAPVRLTRNGLVNSAITASFYVSLWLPTVVLRLTVRIVAFAFFLALSRARATRARQVQIGNAFGGVQARQRHRFLLGYARIRSQIDRETGVAPASL